GNSRTVALPGRPLSVQKPEHERQHGADQKRGHDRDVETEALSLDHDVARQAADPDARENRPEQPRHDENDPEDDKETSHFLLAVREELTDVVLFGHLWSRPRMKRMRSRPLQVERAGPESAAGLGVSVAGQDEDFILVDADFQRNEAVAGARSVDAEAVLDLEQGAVDLADEVFLARAEKAARSPVERRSLVRTAVEVRPKHVSLTDHHD